MSHFVLAPNEPAHMPAGPVVTAIPELVKLMKLRNALVALKGPLANTPGFHRFTEQLLQSNDFYERVLGKLTSKHSL